MESKAWVVAVAALCAVLGSIGQMLFKLGSASVELSLRSWIINIKVLGGMTLYGFSAILFIIALKHGNLSVLYPVIATSYVWVALISTRVFGEPMSLLKWLGIALILGGVTLIARS